MRTLLLGAGLGAAALVAAAATPVAAAETARSVAVSAEDLDLTRTADAEAMLDRIRDAARRACGRTSARMELRAAADYRACVRDATASAVAELDAPLVTALHGGRRDRATSLASVTSPNL